MPAEPSRRISLEWNHNRRSRNASTWAVPLVSKRSWESQAEPQQVSDPAQRTQRVPPPRSRTGGTEFAAAEGQASLCGPSCLCCRPDIDQTGSVASAVMVMTFVSAVAHA